jgi:hypothetical protein
MDGQSTSGIISDARKTMTSTSIEKMWSVSQTPQRLPETIRNIPDSLRIPATLPDSEGKLLMQTRLSPYQAGVCLDLRVLSC